MTEETQQQQTDATATTPQEQNVTGHPGTDGGKAKEAKKEKCRPMTKVVIRRLPPSMTQEQFLEQVSPLPEYDYMYFAKADMSLGQYAFSRAYVDFVDPQDIFEFREKFDNYVFVDAKGQEYPAVVEYAPFQRVPKKRVGKKKDLKCGTIESDPYFISFLESLKNQEGDTANTQPKTEYSFQPSDHAPKKVTSTPLLDFLKQRKQEKQRLRDEKREEKRRRDLERKRSKDEPMVSKVLKNLEEREKEKDKDFNRENKENKDDKDRILPKDMKNRNKQQKEDRYKDKMGRDRESKVPAKNFRDRDDRVKEREIKQNKKHEEKKFYNKKEVAEVHVKEDRVHDKEEVSYKERKLEERRGKSYEKMRQEKKRQAETQKKQNTESTQDEPDEDHDNIEDDGEDDDDDNCMMSPTEKNEDESKSKHINKKTIDSLKNTDGTDKKEHLSEICHVTKTEAAEEAESQTSSTDDNLKEICERLASTTTDSTPNPSDLSPGRLDKKASPSCKRIAKRRSSLESGGENGTAVNVNDSGEAKDTESGASLRRHKSLDGGDDSNLRKEAEDKDGKESSGGKKDPRLERRIRNKDRPAMEIYRPGMGKFSKQRLEREKSGAEERSTPSQSPTPTTATMSSASTTTTTTTTATAATGNSGYKSGKPNGAEVRSMTFKRSVSRDIS